MPDTIYAVTGSSNNLLYSGTDRIKAIEHQGDSSEKIKMTVLSDGIITEVYERLGFYDWVKTYDSLEEISDEISRLEKKLNSKKQEFDKMKKWLKG